MRAAIIGNGVVGSAIASGLEPGALSFIYDLKPEKCHRTLDQINETDLIFVCVPTPTTNGIQTLFALHDSLAYLQRQKFPGIVVVKSTILPGTMEKMSLEYPELRLIHSPEFLTERFAEMDFINQESILLSGPQIYCAIVAKFFREHTKCKGRVKSYEPYAVTEWAKYIHNCLLPVKLSLLNEFHAAIGSQEIYDMATESIERLGNIGTNYQVPGPDGKLGWGGMCFPKDTSAMLAHLHKFGSKCPTLLGAVITNQRIRDEKNDIAGV